MTERFPRRGLLLWGVYCGVYALAILLPFLPYLLRAGAGNTAFIGDQPYADAAVLTASRSPQNMYDLLLVGAGYFGFPVGMVIVLPVFFGVLSLVLFQLLVRRYAPQLELFALALFVGSSSYLILAHQGRWYLLLCLLLGALLVRSRFIAAACLLTLAASFHWVGYVSALIVVLFLSSWRERLLAAFFATGGYWLLASHWQPEVVANSLLADLGTLSGFGAFLVLLAVLGYLIFWRQGGWQRFLPVGVALLFTFDTRMFVVLHPLIVILASGGLVWLYRRRWSLHFLRSLTLYLVFLALVFTLTSTVLESARQPPTSQMVDSLRWLASQEKGVVLTHPQYAGMVLGIAGSGVFPNPWSGEYSKQRSTATALFTSRDLKTTLMLLHQENVTYVWITPAMKRGLVWEEEEQGLLFLFRNERFRTIYREGGVEVWAVR